MSKVLFFDIDGTLVDFGKTYLYDSATEALRKAKAVGNKICICTGRSYNQIYEFLLEEGFDGIVAASGEYVEFEGEVLEHHTFGEENIRKVLDYLKDTNTGLLFQNKELSITSSKWINSFLRTFGENLTVEEMTSNPTFSKLIIDDDVENYPSKYADAESVIYVECDYPVEEVHGTLSPLGLEATLASFKQPEPFSGEITIAGVNKATGIQAIMDKSGISREDVYAFGDGMNDIEMLRFVGTGVAMGNAQQACKDAADVVTDDIKEDGLYRAMEKLGLF